MRAVLLLLVSSVVAGLSACSTMPTTTFDTVAGQHIKKIAIAPIGVAEKADVRIMQPVGANFGLVGALVEEGRAANARAELAKTLSAAGYDYHEDVKQTLLREFSENGFEPILLPGDRASNERLKFLAKLPTDTGSDAILDFVVSYIGFVAAGATTEYRPAFDVMARLVDTKTGKTLFQDSFVYGATWYGAEKAILVPAVEGQRLFSNRDALQSDPKATSIALQQAVQAVIATVVKQLR